ncbi:MAG: cyclic nucleotide-binding domain-containing protein [Verrucomicrobia bacterium]|nr:cyclic nucleotide-binding domain-containing protein [Verrucomicrobiota bacterium]
MKTLYDIVAKQTFFRGLSAEHLRHLADNAMQTWFEADELIFREGDVANRFYLIVEGKVTLESSVTNSQTVLLLTLGPGDLLGWSWLFSPYVWHLHARAIEPTEAIFFYGTRLLSACEADHDLGYEIFKRISEVMMQRLQSTRGKLNMSIAARNVAGPGPQPETTTTHRE